MAQLRILEYPDPRLKKVASPVTAFTPDIARLVRDLAERGLWDPVMVGDLKYFDGALGEIERVPAELKELYATAFEIDSRWLIEAAARRQKWLDQAQSLKAESVQRERQAADADVNHKLDGLPKIFQW